MIFCSLIKSKRQCATIWKQIEWEDEFSDYIMSGLISDSSIAIFISIIDDHHCKSKKKYDIIKVISQNGKIGYSFKDDWIVL
jgi:hypothetical protein